MCEEQKNIIELFVYGSTLSMYEELDKSLLVAIKIINCIRQNKAR